MEHLEKDKLIQLNKYNGFRKDVTHSNNSKNALKNEYVFFGNFDKVKFEGKFDWNYKHHHAVATYQVYLHCIHIVRHLVNSYLSTKDDQYLIKAKEIIEDWSYSKYTQSFQSHNSAWKDHSAASRMKNIIYYQTNAPNEHKLDIELFSNLAHKHCQFLAMKDHYSYNNHGMMSDEALLFISNFIADERLKKEFQEKAILRMESIILRLFSSKNYNLENSPEYHRLTQNLSSRFLRLVDLLELDFNLRCRTIVKKSYEVNAKIIKPDNTFPMIGDTGYAKSRAKKSYDNFIDYQAGIAYINTKNEKFPLKSNWFSFKSGYLSKSHKHLDDLSINYVFKGEDILIDSGKYTYDRRNPKRKLISSPKGHSTIYKMREDYSLNQIMNDLDRVKLNFVFENDNYIHMAGINHLYDDMKIYRDIIYFEHFGFVVIDRNLSNKMQYVGQNFNLSPDLEVTKIDTNQFLLTTPNKNELVLTEHTPRTLSTHYDLDNPNRGFYSVKFNELLETQQIEFKRNNLNPTFVTSMIDRKQIEHFESELISNTLVLKLDNKEFHINLQRLS